MKFNNIFKAFVAGFCTMGFFVCILTGHPFLALFLVALITINTFAQPKTGGNKNDSNR